MKIGQKGYKWIRGHSTPHHSLPSISSREKKIKPLSRLPPSYSRRLYSKAKGNEREIVTNKTKEAATISYFQLVQHILKRNGPSRPCHEDNLTKDTCTNGPTSGHWTYDETWKYRTYVTKQPTIKICTTFKMNRSNVGN